MLRRPLALLPIAGSALAQDHTITSARRQIGGELPFSPNASRMGPAS